MLPRETEPMDPTAESESLETDRADVALSAMSPAPPGRDPSRESRRARELSAECERSRAARSSMDLRSPYVSEAPGLMEAGSACGVETEWPSEGMLLTELSDLRLILLEVLRASFRMLPLLPGVSKTLACGISSAETTPSSARSSSNCTRKLAGTSPIECLSETISDKLLDELDRRTPPCPRLPLLPLCRPVETWRRNVAVRCNAARLLQLLLARLRGAVMDWASGATAASSL